MKLCTFVNANFESCDKPREGNTMCCASHNREVRKQLTDSLKQADKRKMALMKPKKIYAPPNKVSEKRKETNKEYFKLVEQFKKDNPECKAKVNEYCTDKTDDPHHRKGRGKFLLDTTTWLPCCRSCHSYIESHPNIAKEKGWSESRLAITEPHNI